MPFRVCNMYVKKPLEKEYLIMCLDECHSNVEKVMQCPLRSPYNDLHWILAMG